MRKRGDWKPKLTEVVAACRRTKVVAAIVVFASGQLLVHRAEEDKREDELCDKKRVRASQTAPKPYARSVKACISELFKASGVRTHLDSKDNQNVIHVETRVLHPREYKPVESKVARTP